MKSVCVFQLLVIFNWCTISCTTNITTIDPSDWRHYTNYTWPPYLGLPCYNCTTPPIPAPGERGCCITCVVTESVKNKERLTLERKEYCKSYCKPTLRLEVVDCESVIAIGVRVQTSLVLLAAGLLVAMVELQ